MQEPSGLIASPELVNSVTPAVRRRSLRVAHHGDARRAHCAQCHPTGHLRVGQLRDGYWHKSPLLGRYCGTGHIPEMLLSTGYRMLIVYRTSTNQNGHVGFRAYYEAVCGGKVVMEDGVHQSPNYPDDYRPNKECIWKITVPKDYQVALKFQSFEVENHDSCVYDYLEVRDGHDASSQLLGKYCGYRTPDNLRSTTNRMLVKFVSDRSVNKAKFSATFMKDACGGMIEASNGSITSPSFAILYPSNKNYIWEIVASPQYRITFNFTHSDLEGNNVNCEYDKVDILSKMDNNTIRKHGLFCGSYLLPIITSEGNSLRIEFSSDNSVQKSGFAAVFLTDKDECAQHNGGCQHICKNTISAPLGEINCPNYPDANPSRKDCAWLFTTTPGHRLKLIFNDFELQPHQECAYDPISLYDGDSTDAPTLGRFCGAKVHHPILSTTNRMYMMTGEFTSSSGSLPLHFRSDDNINAKGFSAAYLAVDTVEFGQQHAPVAPPFSAGASGLVSEVRAPHRRERRLRLHRH
ncbi:hypothetical protein MRX96_059467 [Rhipicephalus microplus]